METAKQDTPIERIFGVRHTNSTFVVQERDKDGRPIPGVAYVLQAHGNYFRTSDPDAVSALEKVAKQKNPAIFMVSEEEIRAAGLHIPLSGDENRPFEEVKERAGQVVEAIAKAGQHAN
jgi:hypothetical protein